MVVWIILFALMTSRLPITISNSGEGHIPCGAIVSQYAPTPEAAMACGHTQLYVPIAAQYGTFYHALI